MVLRLTSSFWCLDWFYKVVFICVNQEPIPTSQDYLNEYREKLQNVDMYKHMLEQRCQLPVFQYKSTLIEAIKNNRVVVVKGATGCGKTTQVPKSYYESTNIGLFSATPLSPVE